MSNITVRPTILKEWQPRSRIVFLVASVLSVAGMAACTPAATRPATPASDTVSAEPPDETAKPPVESSGLPEDVAALFDRELAFPLDYETSFSDPAMNDGDVEPYPVWKSKVTCRVTGLRKVAAAWVSTHACTTNPTVPEDLGADYKAPERPAPTFTETYVATESGFWLAHWPAADDEDIAALLETTPLVTLPVKSGYDGATRVTKPGEQSWCVQNAGARISYLCIHQQLGIVNRVRRGSDHVDHTWVNWQRP
jgi:hypothetical protein